MVISKSGKSQNKAGVADEIGISKKFSMKKLNDNLVIKNHVPGWVAVKSRFRDCLQRSKIYFELRMKAALTGPYKIVNFQLKI